MLNTMQAYHAGVLTYEEAWGKLVGVQTEIANEPDHRSSTAAAALVGKAIGALASEKQVDSGAAPGSDLAELLAAWRQAKQDNPELGQRAAGLLRSESDAE
jgi:hypothetical protein